jgi:glycolate oxidase iron-sulfur subunit
MAESKLNNAEAPLQKDLDKCVHCGLCLNACPTYRELGVEMDSPRGRIYQMVQITTGQAEMSQTYVDHMDLCLACRGCETACPSGVQYGKLIEAARAHIEDNRPRPWPIRLFRWFLFGQLLQTRWMLALAGTGLYLYQASGLQKFVRSTGLLKAFGKLAEIEQLSPSAETPFFFGKIGKVFPAEGTKKYKVAFLAGCLQNVTFARLNEATVRVLQKNGCEVHIPADQGCCGALHVHSGRKADGRSLARKNIDAVPAADYDAIISNTGGCGSNLKEYHELLENDPAYHDRAHAFVKKMRDVNEFLGSIELNTKLAPMPLTVTYQDSCHLAHGQKVRVGPRKLLAAVPQLNFKEMPMSDLCCGSAGIYNVVQSEMASQLLKNKMGYVNGTGAEVILSSNPGCMLQLDAGARLHGKGQRVMHIVQLLDESYQKYQA